MVKAKAFLIFLTWAKVFVVFHWFARVHWLNFHVHLGIFLSFAEKLATEVFWHSVWTPKDTLTGLGDHGDLQVCRPLGLHPVLACSRLTGRENFYFERQREKEKQSWMPFRLTPQILTTARGIQGFPHWQKAFSDLSHPLHLQQQEAGTGSQAGYSNVSTLIKNQTP